MTLKAIILALLVAVSRRPEAVLEPWADQILVVCGGDDTKVCIRFASQAVAEGGFVAYSLDGRCNDPKWRDAWIASYIARWHRRPTWVPCDAGLAAGPWQLHYAELGISAADARDPIKGTAAAWDYWRRAPYAWSTWRDAERIASHWIPR